MNLPFELEPDEKVLFEGDVTLSKSALKVVQGLGVGTTHRFFFTGEKKGPLTIRREDIQTADEVKHGFARKWVVKTRQNETHQFIAANAGGLRHVMYSLTGQKALAEAASAQPALSQVRNRTAWLAAFGPIIGGMIIGFLLGMQGVDFSADLSLRTTLTLVIGKLLLIYVFLKVDHLSLQSQGYQVHQLGLADPSSIFTYLFSRARVFGHRKWYALTWCLAFALQVLALLA